MRGTVMKFWLDTEFNGYKGELISIALVCRDGSFWYGVREPKHYPNVDPWVAEHVIPFLDQEPQTDEALLKSLAQYLDRCIWCKIIADWPEDVAHFCNFLITGPGERIDTPYLEFFIDRDLNSDKSRIPHNALEDARAISRMALGENAYDSI